MNNESTYIHTFVLLERALDLLGDNCKWSNTALRESLIREINDCLHPTITISNQKNVQIPPMYKDITIGSKWLYNDGINDMVVTVSLISGGIVTVAKFDGMGGELSCKVAHWFDYFKPFNNPNGI